MHSGPALLTVVLQTSNTATEEWSWFAIALDTVTLITELVIKNVRLELHLHSHGYIMLAGAVHNQLLLSAIKLLTHCST